MFELSVGKYNFPAYLTRPSGAVRGGVILVHEVWGLDRHIKSVADRFSSEGYVTLAPDLLSGANVVEQLSPQLQKDLFDPAKRTQVQPKLREIMAPLHAPGFAEQTLEKLKVCFRYLETEDGVEDRRAICGFCFGGSYSFSLAVAEPKLKAAVPFYGHADFTVEELRKIKCPILAFYGENDRNLISGLDQLKDDMRSAGVDFESIVYPDCGHAFFNDSNPLSYNEVAASHAWKETLRFLDKNLS